MPTPAETRHVIPAKPRIAVLLGDPGGVGPEMAVKLLARQRNLDAARVLLIADPLVLAAGERVAGVKLDALRLDSLDTPRFEDGRPSLFARDWMNGTEAVLGESNEASGRASFEALELATQAVRHGQADAILFAPLNKHSLRLGGLVHEDELRYMQERFAVKGFVCEFNLTGSLWTSRVTSHIPLKDVASHITVQGVQDAVKIIAAALRRAGVAQPRIAVTGLRRVCDVLRQHLAQLHAPLVEAVDAPQAAAGEHAVLVQRQQRAQLAGRQRVQQEEGAGPVAAEVAVAAGVLLALHQRLRLRQRIGQQQLVVQRAAMGGLP
jgi:hypothetical protein